MNLPKRVMGYYHAYWSVILHDTERQNYECDDLVSLTSDVFTRGTEILQSYNSSNSDKRLFTLNDKFRYSLRNNVDHINRELWFIAYHDQVQIRSYNNISNLVLD